MSSQATSILMICCFALIAPYIANIDRVVFSAGLLASAAAVSIASAIGVRALAPPRAEKTSQKIATCTHCERVFRRIKSRSDAGATRFSHVNAEQDATSRLIGAKIDVCHRFALRRHAPALPALSTLASQSTRECRVCACKTKDKNKSRHYCNES
jgi:hypothetical protein